MSQFKRGFGIAGQSWRTLRSHRSLAAFPILGGAMALVVVAPPALAGAYLADRGDTVPGAVLGAVAIYLVCFVSAFVGVGLAAAADAALRGEPASLGQGVGAARKRLPAIAGWALINALLSIVLRALETRSELATIAAALVGGAWSVVSLLAIPAIALEDAGPVEAIKRSGSLFKQHWGGRVTGMAGIGGGAVLLALGAVLFAGAAVLSNALRQIFAVALFRFTTSGEAIGGFDGADLEHAVRVKGRPVVA
jgi:Family of unknown function (DUF6159)